MRYTFEHLGRLRYIIIIGYFGWGPLGVASKPAAERRTEPLEDVAVLNNTSLIVWRRQIANLTLEVISSGVSWRGKEALVSEAETPRFPLMD